MSETPTSTGDLAREMAELRLELNAMKAEQNGRARGRKRTVRLAVLFVLAGLFAGTASFADPAVALLCPGGDLYCFLPNSPARATQVNHNFAQLKAWTEQKVGPVGSGDITLSGNFTGDRLSSAANAQLGVSSDFVFRDTGDTWLRLRDGANSDTYADLAVMDSWVEQDLKVVGDMDVDGNIKGGFTWTDFAVVSRSDTNGATDLALNINESKGICFLTQITFEDIEATGEKAECRVFTDTSGNWIVRAYLAGTPDANATCVARCLVWDRS